jgi:hypothetical protein
MSKRLRDDDAAVASPSAQEDSSAAPHLSADVNMSVTEERARQQMQQVPNVAPSTGAMDLSSANAAIAIAPLRDQDEEGCFAITADHMHILSEGVVKEIRDASLAYAAALEQKGETSGHRCINPAGVANAQVAPAPDVQPATPLGPRSRLQNWYQLSSRLREGHVAVITGAGVSAALAPDHVDVLVWTSFMNSLFRRVQGFLDCDCTQFRRFKLETGSTEQADTVRSMVAKFAAVTHTHVDYHHLVQEMMEPVRAAEVQASHTHHSLAEAIRALGAPIITTNYDVLLDRLLGRMPVNLMGDLLRAHRHSRLDSFLNLQLHHGNKYVYHVHGVYSERDGFVLARKEYEQLHLAFILVMKQLLGYCVHSPTRERRSMLLLGVGEGMCDDHFVALLTELRDLAPTGPHFWVLSERDVAVRQAWLDKNNLSNVLIVPFGSARTDLLPFLWHVALAAGFRETATTTSHLTAVEQTGTVVRIQAVPECEDAKKQAQADAGCSDAGVLSLPRTSDAPAEKCTFPSPYEPLSLNVLPVCTTRTNGTQPAKPAKGEQAVWTRVHTTWDHKPALSTTEIKHVP